MDEYSGKDARKVLVGKVGAAKREKYPDTAQARATGMVSRPDERGDFESADWKKRGR